MAAGITENDVWKAADALLLEGLRPTIERVRQKIGRGSPNTVSPYLETWFKSLGSRIKDPGAFSAPASLPDPIRHAAKHFWEAALTAARAELTAHEAQMRKELDAEREQLAQLRSALDARQSALEGQLVAKGEALALAQNQVAEATERMAQLESGVARQARILEQMQVERDESRAELTAASKRIEREREEWTAERRDIESRHHAAEGHWADEVDRARQVAERRETELARERVAAAHNAAAWNEERERLMAQKAAEARQATQAVETVQKQAAEASRELAKALTAQELLGHRLSHIEAQNERLMNEVRDKEAERAALLTQVLHGQLKRKGTKRPAA